MFDVLVIGAGHAGCEAAAAAARRGARVGLLTFRAEDVGQMSCNPSIGGVGKGHLVRELDVFDGLMARAADRAAIHRRMLNRSKGPAVWGPRVQADRTLYRAAVARAAARDRRRGDRRRGARPGRRERPVVGRRDEHGTLACRALVIATGTFLDARLFVGEEVVEGGRRGERPRSHWRRRSARSAWGRAGSRPARRRGSTGARSTGRGSRSSRATTSRGRCRRSTMAFASRSCAARSRGPMRAPTTSSAPISTARRCSPARSRGGGRAIARRSRTRCSASAIATATRSSSSPRASTIRWSIPTASRPRCPPTSRREFVRSIAGLERAEIVRPGYAVEYDYVDPRRLSSTLEVRDIAGLFLAGQINGTTGYEEAAAQGLVGGPQRGGVRARPDRGPLRPPHQLYRRDGRRPDASGRQRAVPDDDRARRISGCRCAPTMRPPGSARRRSRRTAFRERRRAQLERHFALRSSSAWAETDGGAGGRALSRPMSSASSANGKSCSVTLRVAIPAGARLWRDSRPFERNGRAPGRRPAGDARPGVARSRESPRRRCRRCLSRRALRKAA